MNSGPQNTPLENFSEHDAIAEFVQRENITVGCIKIESRPDVSLEEQQQWVRQDPEYPPEHYHCELRRGDRTFSVYQTVGADYPDEDEEGKCGDLYRDSRELMLSPEFLIETAALKANSVEEATNLSEWLAAGFCETATPEETYRQFQIVRENLKLFLDDEKYRTLIQLAVEAEMERDEEFED